MTAPADRLKLSNQQYFAITAGLLKSAGVNEEDVSLSRATVKRNRDKHRDEIAEKLVLEFAER